MDSERAGRWDPGSFRDRASRVFRREGEVFRSLGAEGLSDWERLHASDWFEALQAAGKVVRTWRVDDARRAEPEQRRAGESASAAVEATAIEPAVTELRAIEPAGVESPAAESRTGEPAASESPAAEPPATELRAVESPAFEPPAIEPPWAATLAHETIPFVSYPYEWPFGMLQDAALLHLEVLEAALGGGMILKDGSSYNVQWTGTRPVFVDVGSFTAHKPGEPWAGYRQFCRHFLFPLLLQAYKDVPFQPWLRGSLEGIQAGDMARLMSARDLLRPGVFTHVWLQAKAEARYGEGAARSRGRRVDKPGEVRAALRGAGFHTGLIRANVRRLKRLVGGLGSAPTRSRWTDYAHALPYTEAERAEKAAFVRQVVHARDRTMVWDLGCNTGAFARIAAERAGTVVAMDSDPRVVEALYQALKEEGATGILPLVGDVADPSPDRGWRGAERRSPERRGSPELVLVLALVHHLVVGASIPLPEVTAWLASFGAAVIVEFVDREDPMVRALLDAKDERYDDYDRHQFERHLSDAFETKARKVLGSGTRILYYAEPKAWG